METNADSWLSHTGLCFILGWTESHDSNRHWVSASAGRTNVIGILLNVRLKNKPLSHSFSGEKEVVAYLWIVWMLICGHSELSSNLAKVSSFATTFAERYALWGGDISHSCLLLTPIRNPEWSKLTPTEHRGIGPNPHRAAAVLPLWKTGTWRKWYNSFRRRCPKEAWRSWCTTHREEIFALQQCCLEPHAEKLPNGDSLVLNSVLVVKHGLKVGHSFKSCIMKVI